MQNDPIVITGAARTPIGSFQGALAPVSAPDLGAAAVAAAIERSAVSVESIEEVVMGCVLPAGLRQAPARQAALGAAFGKLRDDFDGVQGRLGLLFFLPLML